MVFAAASGVAAALIIGLSVAMAALFAEREARTGEAEQRKRAENQTTMAEVETSKADLANLEIKRNLHLASMADLASAIKALEEDSEARHIHQSTRGFAGKSRWHEGVSLLARSLEREPANRLAALRLFETLRSRQPEKCDWPIYTFKYDGAVGLNVNLDFARGAALSSNGTKIVAVSGNKLARIWDAATGQVIGEPLEHIGCFF